MAVARLAVARSRSGLLAGYRRWAPWAYVVLIAGLYVRGFSGAGLGDAHAYFRAAADPSAMYAQHAVDMPDAYMYAPVFAQLLAPLARLGWLMFSACWFTLLAASLWWLAREWSPIAIFVPVIYFWSTPFIYPPVGSELNVGNIQLLIAVALVLSFRWPWTWAFPLLTKPTLGVGLLWYAVRREWRSLGIALVTTALVGLCSTILAPSLWVDWVRELAENAVSGAPNSYDAPFQFFPLVLRLTFAAMLVAWGARSDRRWTLIVAALIAMPVMWRTGPAVLLGILALWRSSPKRRLLAGRPEAAPFVTGHGAGDPEGRRASFKPHCATKL